MASTNNKNFITYLPWPPPRTSFPTFSRLFGGISCLQKRRPSTHKPRLSKSSLFKKIYFSRIKKARSFISTGLPFV